MTNKLQYDPLHRSLILCMKSKFIMRSFSSRAVQVRQLKQVSIFMFEQHLLTTLYSKSS